MVYYAWVRTEKDVASHTVNICFLHCETRDVIESIQTILYTPARQSIKTLELDKLCVVEVLSTDIKALRNLSVDTKWTWDVTWRTWGCWQLTPDNFFVTLWSRWITWYMFWNNFSET